MGCKTVQQRKDGVIKLEWLVPVAIVRLKRSVCANNEDITVDQFGYTVVDLDLFHSKTWSVHENTVVYAGISTPTSKYRLTLTETPKPRDSRPITYDLARPATLSMVERSVEKVKAHHCHGQSGCWPSS